MTAARRGDEIASFKAWLAARGAEVLLPTNEWELVRFAGDGVTSIVYATKSGARTYTGLARAAWDAFKDGDPKFRIVEKKATGRHLRAKRGKPSPLVRTILERDGPLCFYCGAAFCGEVRPTKEHLVSVTAGGPDHISNLFLSCAPCNVEAGHLSAPEKIRLRDRKRRGLGAKLLGRVLEGGGSESFQVLLRDVKTFLEPAAAGGKEEPHAAV